MATEFARNYIVYTGTLQRGRRWLLNRGILSLHKRFRVMVRPAGDRPYPQRKLLVLDKRKLHRDGLPFFGAITDVGLVFHRLHVSTPPTSASPLFSWSVHRTMYLQIRFRWPHASSLAFSRMRPKQRMPSKQNSKWSWWIPYKSAPIYESGVISCICLKIDSELES